MERLAADAQVLIFFSIVRPRREQLRLLDCRRAAPSQPSRHRHAVRRSQPLPSLVAEVASGGSAVFSPRALALCRTLVRELDGCLFRLHSLRLRRDSAATAASRFCFARASAAAPLMPLNTVDRRTPRKSSGQSNATNSPRCQHASPKFAQLWQPSPRPPPSCFPTSNSWLGPRSGCRAARA